VLSNESTFANSHVGTPYYMSPEQIEDKQYNDKSDIWSLGCFLYEITTLNPPFEATNHFSLAKKIKIGKTEKKYQQSTAKIFKKTINWLLTVDLNKRPSIDQLIKINQVDVRKREFKIKENLQKLKTMETLIKNKENEMEKKENDFKKWENDLALREETLRKREEDLSKKEKKIEEKRESFKQ